MLETEGVIFQIDAIGASRDADGEPLTTWRN